MLGDTARCILLAEIVYDEIKQKTLLSERSDLGIFGMSHGTAICR